MEEQVLGDNVINGAGYECSLRHLGQFNSNQTFYYIDEIHECEKMYSSKL